jgi:hypothetical protein
MARPPVPAAAADALPDMDSVPDLRPWLGWSAAQAQACASALPLWQAHCQALLPWLAEPLRLQQGLWRGEPASWMAWPLWWSTALSPPSVEQGQQVQRLWRHLMEDSLNAWLGQLRTVNEHASGALAQATQPFVERRSRHAQVIHFPDRRAPGIKPI